MGDEDKGYIDGWFDGGDVRLYYTKSYYCSKLPLSDDDSSDCENSHGEYPRVLARGVEPDCAREVAGQGARAAGRSNGWDAGVISADTATNIYFFIAGARPD